MPRCRRVTTAQSRPIRPRPWAQIRQHGSGMVRHVFRPIAATVVAAQLLLACSSAPPVPHPTSQPPTARASSSPTPGACGGPCFPATDTPFAQASAALQAAWKKYRVEIIPGQDVVADLPTLPTVTGDPSVSSSQADLLGAAFRLYEKLEQWDDRVDHAGLTVGSQTLGEDYIFDDAVAVGVSSGGTTDAPDCLYFGTKATALRVPDDAVNQMKEKGQASAESTGLVIDVAGPCTAHLTKDGTTTVADHWDAPFKALLTGHIVADPVLGTYLFVDGQFRCDDPQVPALRRVCAESL